MVTVFFSHSSKDKIFVRELADFLEEGGEIKVWIDEREVNYGENVILKIDEALDADAVLLILSPDSVDSKWVKEEWSAAYWEQVNYQHTKLAGALYRDCKLPHFIANKKYFDLRTNHPEGFRQIKSWLLGLRPYTLPVVHLPPRPPLFVGRELELKELRRRLREPGSVVHIPGLPGRGKTTLALQFAHLNQHDFEAVHWLPCQSLDIPYLVGELARQLGMKLEGDPETSMRDLLERFASKRCLLILDNVEDEAPGRLIPGGSSSVLITTRRTDLSFLDLYKPLELPLFTEEQCLQLFRDVLGEKEVSKHESAAKSLFRRLGFLPIAIKIAASLIRKDVRHTIDSLSAHPPDGALSFLKTAIGALPQNAQTLLSAMSACAPEGFLWALGTKIAELDENISLNALQELTSRSLLEEMDRTSRRYRAHALVRDAAAPPAPLRIRHATLIQEQFRNWETEWRQCQEDLADLQHALNWALEKNQIDERWNLANDLAYLGYVLTKRLGRFPEAYEFCDRLDRESIARGARNEHQVWLGNKALILQAWGQLEEAMALHKRKEAICQELNKRYSLQISYGNQALILRAWGRLDEAMALHKKEEAICLELGDRRGLQASYGNQALILRAWGQLEEAMDLHKKQETISLELNDRDGLQRCYCGQALVLKAWGRLEEAMALHKREEAICLELNDRDGLQRSYGNQALILQDWGRLEEAIALFEKQEAICLELNLRSSLGNCYWSMADIRKELGDLKAARKGAAEALSIFTQLGMPRQIKGVKELLKKLG
jgi:tetratricopeptide (TPR) repeat protein